MGLLMVKDTPAELEKYLGLSPIDLALKHAVRGWSIFPCKPDKRPYTQHGKDDSTTDPGTIRAWWQLWPAALIGIYCERSGLFCVDIDLDHIEGVNGFYTLAGLIDTVGNGKPVLPYVGPVQNTPRGGQHYLFKLPEGMKIPNRANALGPGLDIRSNGYIITGIGYSWVPGHSPDAQLTDAPAWLLNMITEPKRASTAEGSGNNGHSNQESGDFWLNRALNMAVPGIRNQTGFWLGCQWRDAGVPIDHAERLVGEYAARVPGDGYTEEEALASIRSAYSSPPRNPARRNGGKSGNAHLGNEPAICRSVIANYENDHYINSHLIDIALTDAGNGEYIAALYGDQVRYDHRRRRWLSWNEHRWAKDEDGLITRISLDAARHRLRLAAEMKDQDKRCKTAKWALASENHARLNAAVDIARDLYPITIIGDEFDADPWLVGCKNGVIDLQTGELRHGRQPDNITMSTGIDYNPEAQAPRFEQFLREIFNNDAGLMEFVFMSAGYSLSGITREHVLLLCHGNGANGKTTLFNALRGAFGEYASNTPFSTFELSSQNINNDVAALAGARFVTAAETSEARRLNEARIKAITGDEPVTARFLFSEWFTYTPTYKVWLAMNQKPIVNEADNGIKRRVKLIPFENNFMGREDRHLGEVLKAEAPGILAWAVRGCLAWLHNGKLPEPAAIRIATDEYMKESDIIGQFLDDCIIKRDEERVKASDLYAAYKAWCVKQGEKEITGTAFGRRMKERDGIDSAKVGHNVWYLGLELAGDEIH